jgi:transcriptional regulator with XRE-family HTH domain
MGTRGNVQGALGLRLESLRLRAGLTQRQLAAKAGLSLDEVRSIEQGRAANPTLKTLFRLSSALDVSMAELLKGVSPHPEAGP